MLIWKNGPVIVGETTSFHAVVVLNSKPEEGGTLETDKNVKCEFSWNVSSHSWIDRRTTDECHSSFNWRWTECRNHTVFVSVGIYYGRDVEQEENVSSRYKSYHVTNQTSVSVSVKEKQASVFSCHLAIKSFAGLKLPPDKPPYNLPKNSPVEFEVQFKDPQKLVTNVSTDWAFYSQKWNVLHYIVTEWPNGTMYHMFPEMGVYMAEVTVRATLKGNQKWSLVFVKKLIVKDPVSLKVQHKHLKHKDKTVRFNISCNGSFPVSCHWCVSKECNLPHGELCNSTLQHYNSCSLMVNHTFRSAGNYCVNIGLMNDVSATNTSFMVKIPAESPSPKERPRKGPFEGTKTITIVLVFAAIILLFAANIAVRKLVSSRRVKAAEKADFEFRDYDALSVSSGNTACSSRFKLWSIQRSLETAPFCKESRLYTF